jgi:hypothetical protein
LTISFRTVKRMAQRLVMSDEKRIWNPTPDTGTPCNRTRAQFHIARADGCRATARDEALS